MLDPIKIEWQKCSTNILYLDIIYFIFLERKSGIWNAGYFSHVFESYFEDINRKLALNLKYHIFMSCLNMSESCMSLCNAV